MAQRLPDRRLWFRIAALALSAGTGVICLELLVRFLSPPNPFSPRLALRPFERFQNESSLRGVTSPSRFTTNSWGFRGAEPPRDWDSAYTVVAIGGSTTQCHYLDDARTWPALVEESVKAELPGTWVGNAGLDGHTTRGHLVFMEEVIPRVRPRLVLLMAGINDMGLSFSEERRLRGNPLDGTSALYRLFGSNRLLQVLFAWKKALWDRAHVVRRSGHAMAPVRFISDPDTPPADVTPLLAQWPEYRQNLGLLARRARGAGVDIVFLTQPMLYDDTEPWTRIEPEYDWMKTTGRYSAAAHARFLAAYNRAMIEVAAEEGVECVDLSALVPHDESCFYDPVHLTEEGARRVAAAVAPLVRARATAWAAGRSSGKPVSPAPAQHATR